MIFPFAEVVVVAAAAVVVVALRLVPWRRVAVLEKRKAENKYLVIYYDLLIYIDM